MTCWARPARPPSTTAATGDLGGSVRPVMRSRWGLHQLAAVAGMQRSQCHSSYEQQVRLHTAACRAVLPAHHISLTSAVLGPMAGLHCVHHWCCTWCTKARLAATCSG